MNTICRERDELQKRVEEVDDDLHPKCQTRGDATGPCDSTLSSGLRARKAPATDKSATTSSVDGFAGHETALGAKGGTDASWPDACVGMGWLMAHDETSGQLCYCPVQLNARGTPVWELPQEGIIFTRAPAQQIRDEQQNEAQAALDAQATERAQSLFRMLLAILIVSQCTIAVAFAAYFEWTFGMFSNMFGVSGGPSLAEGGTQGLDSARSQ